MTLDDITGWLMLLFIPICVLAVGITIIEWMWKSIIKDFKKTFNRNKKVDK